MNNYSEQINALCHFIQTNQPLLILTGAGCSTDSGIPDYRDENGAWKNKQPVQFRDFVADVNVRKRYWARSMAGWTRISVAKPNAAHIALAQLQQQGLVHLIITQNVDGLHQKAGDGKILDLHGRLESVVCINCGASETRKQFQDKLERHNQSFTGASYTIAPDGDAELMNSDFSGFYIPPCQVCDGILKPDVVFFGESVPKSRLNIALEELARAAGLLVIGSSLMVYSGYRFCKIALETNKPVAVINLGHTRADGKLQLKIEHSCAKVLIDVTKQILQTSPIQ